MTFNRSTLPIKTGIETMAKLTIGRSGTASLDGKVIRVGRLKAVSHAIIYFGAPYGLNERGHIVARLKSFDAAVKGFNKRFAGTPSSYDNMIVALKTSGSGTDRTETWQREPAVWWEGARIAESLTPQR